jgi:DNA-binding CsgD family transcriptional regulator
LPPKEYQYLKLLAANPGISNPAAARELGVVVGTVKSLRHRIKKTHASA